MLRRTVSLAFSSFKTPFLINEPMDNFEPNSSSAKGVLSACKELRSVCTECPLIIGGKPYTTEDVAYQTMPSDHSVKIAKYYLATPELAKKAVESALTASKEWSHYSFQDRAAIILKAAHLISTKYRHLIRAATMLGQSKNPWQAEIDCVAESCDFLRYNVKFAEELYAQQPLSPAIGVLNSLEYRPLEGFVSAITPFNFTAIAANLATCPALLGNTVVWKPSSTAILSNYLMYKILEEAGLPAGVINFLPCQVPTMGEVVHSHPLLSCVAFTGSTRAFTEIQKLITGQLEVYRNIPRITGETGGKDFHIIHPSADLKLVAACTTRGAFEYQGQKCSATSRLYAPRSQWKELKELLIRAQSQIKMGQPDDFANFMCAVIDKNAFEKHKKYIQIAKDNAKEYTIICGGKCDDSQGYFVEPTIIETNNPDAVLLKEEIFGPILTVYVYDDAAPNYWEKVCTLADQTTSYALTGSIFSRDRQAIIDATNRYLRYSAGNFYINDKCTGAVVGQQPFGGARASGSNDKPGSAAFLNRFVSVRTIKENFDLTPVISYPHQQPDFIKL